MMVRMMVEMMVVIMLVEMAMRITRYLITVVLHQLIESTHMTIRDLMENRIKVEILVQDSLIVIIWLNLLTVRGLIRVMTCIIHISHMVMIHTQVQTYLIIPRFYNTTYHQHRMT